MRRTEVVGVYTNRDAAQAAVVTVESGGDSWARHGGQGFVDVFGPLRVGQFVDPGPEKVLA